MLTDDDRELRAWTESGKAPAGSCPFCASRISMVQRDGFFRARCSHRGCGATGPKMRSITRAADLFCCPPQRTAGGSAIAARPSTGTVGELLARPLCEWHEDNGAVLWWRFPIDEPPYSGSPLDDGWPGYHTHWTECAIPAGHAPANAHPDGCHTTSADAHRDCDGDGHYECATCTRRDPEERERNGDPPIGGVK